MIPLNEPCSNLGITKIKLVWALDSLISYQSLRYLWNQVYYWMKNLITLRALSVHWFVILLVSRVHLCYLGN